MMQLLFHNQVNKVVCLLYVFVCFLSKVCLLHVCGNGWDKCMFYVCFMIGFHSLQYDWFPLTNQLLRLLRIAPTPLQYTKYSTQMRREPRRSKGSSNNRSAKAATLAVRRQHRIGRSAQAAAEVATGRSTSYSIGNSCRKQHWPQRAGRSNGRSAQATPKAAALAAARRLQHWPQRAGHTTNLSTNRSVQATVNAAPLAAARRPH